MLDGAVKLALPLHPYMKTMLVTIKHHEHMLQQSAYMLVKPTNFVQVFMPVVMHEHYNIN